VDWLRTGAAVVVPDVAVDDLDALEEVVVAGVVLEVLVVVAPSEEPPSEQAASPAARVAATAAQVRRLRRAPRGIPHCARQPAAAGALAGRRARRATVTP
jgi:hypothetical protein